MKWFKHYSGSLNSESLADLIRDTGFQGYGRYWVLLEHLAGLFDGQTIDFRIPVENIRTLLRIRSWTELGTFLDRLATIRGLDVKRNGNVYEIKASILLELQDRDFKKARKDRGEDAPKIKNKIKNKNIYSDVEKFDFESIYKIYPRQAGKQKGIEKLMREIKSKEDFELFKKCVLNYKSECLKLRTDLKYIKHFDSFVTIWRDWIDYNNQQPAQATKQAQEVYQHIENFEYNDEARKKALEKLPFKIKKV